MPKNRKFKIGRDAETGKFISVKEAEWRKKQQSLKRLKEKMTYIGHLL